MALDKNKIKEALEQEKKMLFEQLQSIAKLNPENGDWEAVPEASEFPETDQNDMADRFEDFESRSSMIKVLEPRYNNVLSALENLNSSSFGACMICKKPIEEDRLEANPAARTCKEHLEA